MAWLSGFSKRKELVLTGGASGSLTDFQLKLAVSYEAAMDGDFDDLRFTQADGTTLIDAWAEVIVTDTSATVWVEFPTTPANTIEQTYYLYYGNAAVASDWDIGATFLFGDDFEDGDYTSDPTWTVQSGTWSAANNYLEKTANDGTWQHISVPFAADSGVWEFKMKGLGTSSQELIFYFMSKETNFQNGYFIYFPDTTMYLYKIVGGAGTSLGSYNWGVDGNWHDFKLERDTSGGMKLYLDGTERISATNTEVSDSAYMICRTPRLESFDTIRVRKYAANPPTYAFGSEESTGHPTMRRWGGIPGMPNGTGRRSW